MRGLFTLCAAVILFTTSSAFAGTWTTLDYPGASDTMIYGISGRNLVGRHGGHGCLYNGTSWSTLDAPWGSGDNALTDISGNNIIGTFNTGNAGFLYDGTNWTVLPGCAYGINGINIVGTYHDSDWLSYGFLYNTTNQTWNTFNIVPGETAVYGIDGSNIVGGYFDGRANHGFLYNLTTEALSTLDAPGATYTAIRGIDGSNLVGMYEDSSGYDHGCLYNVTNQSWTILDMPGAAMTDAYGIDGNKIVGTYNASGVIHGFVYEIPEPMTLLLLGLGGLMLRRKH